MRRPYLFNSSFRNSFTAARGNKPYFGPRMSGLCDFNGFYRQGNCLLAETDVIIVTFGDLVRVPGSSSSLEKEKMKGADVRIVFSGLEALNIARSNKDKAIIFLGIGFETTAPGTAVTVKMAKEEGLNNFLLLSAHKVMPPVMEAIVNEGIQIDGFICPGHVAAITGSRIFEFLPEKYGLGCVISGFEPADLLQSVLMLVKQVNLRNPSVEIQYTRAVTEDGNIIARNHLSEVFESCDTNWRGFGIIREAASD